jgi:hypothetical protein
MTKAGSFGASDADQRADQPVGSAGHELHAIDVIDVSRQ